MSSIIAQTLDPPATLTSPSEIEIAARHASRRRRQIVVAARIGILVAVLAGWELGATLIRQNFGRQPAQAAQAATVSKPAGAAP